MKVADFGKNIYQCDVSLKFDFFSAESLKTLAQIFTSKGFSIAKDATTIGQTLVTKGKGTEQEPYYQVKVSADKLGFWVGWHVKFEEWQRWRDLIIVDICAGFPNLRPEYVSAILPQVTINVPRSNLKDISQIEEFRSLLEFHQRYIPTEYLGRINAYHGFGTGDGSRTAEWQYGETPEQATFVFLSRKLSMNQDLSVQKNIGEHFVIFDTLLEGFHSSVISPSLK